MHVAVTVVGLLVQFLALVHHQEKIVLTVLEDIDIAISVMALIQTSYLKIVQNVAVGELFLFQLVVAL